MEEELLTESLPDDETPEWEGTLGKPFLHFLLRAFVALPVGAVALALCMTVILLPIGLPLALAVGHWVSKPLREHPIMNLKGDAE